MDKRGNTLIKTDDGYKEIKDIEVGDLVYSEDPLTGEKGLKRVTNIFVNETSVLVRIYVGDEEIETTPTHPFWVIEKGWVAAGDIEAGDKVYLYSGEGREVKEVRFEYLDTPIKVYNFEVEDWHTYFVSEQDVFVHNSCKGKGTSKTQKPIGKEFDPKGKTVQEGIDPNTLKPVKDLDTLDPIRQKNAIKYAGDKPIIVDRNGNVLDGHHRLKDAIQNGRAVDVQIGY